MADVQFVPPCRQDIFVGDPHDVECGVGVFCSVLRWLRPVQPVYAGHADGSSDAAVSTCGRDFRLPGTGSLLFLSSRAGNDFSVEKEKHGGDPRRFGCRRKQAEGLWEKFRKDGKTRED